MNLGPFYDLAGRSQSLNQAYGIQNKAELIRDVCPRVNPVDLAVDLTWLPLRTWQGRDDQVTPPRDLERFDCRDPRGRRLALDHVMDPAAMQRRKGPAPSLTPLPRLRSHRRLNATPLKLPDRASPGCECARRGWCVGGR